MEEIRPIQKEVTIEDTTYRVIITPLDDKSGKKTFKGLMVDMMREDEHFARDRFASNVNAEVIRNWMLNMHRASQNIERTLEAFRDWDGELNAYW
ncbi:TPA: hypothetical protein H9347_002831 [Listeria monocytogenes]|uniref:hypothetical protein n=1 Tax=Listeria monocytogenes TaxID=1639 RepID=UPI0010B2700F|nr:hypothetical protein [Listeria monocytogenes]EAC4247955.1 hypothetical protein [Listeria monocytogenes]EAE4158367.1 hypothetical protein [Listeria monocytogenes]EAH1140480.1 hypothetical protein [Listeria monocytogenes]EIN2603752.1 hypothetical protein [Listeria monocytogenes]EIO3384776.1 hypothetical protein [Listeria monocytogenes]